MGLVKDVKIENNEDVTMSIERRMIGSGRNSEVSSDLRPMSSTNALRINVPLR